MFIGSHSLQQRNGNSHFHTMHWHSAGQTALPTHAATWMNPECVVLCEEDRPKRLHVWSFDTTLEKKGKMVV
jgi:L-ascorbate metabolism protein UlaG (beta-lactamase superfamily)